MSLERAIQLVTAALAVTGAAFLGLGHSSVLMPLVLAVSAALAFAITDVWRWLLLNRLLANLIALVAVAWSLRNFFELGGSEGQLLAIANMLVYLQVVLLFQDKSPRIYWQLLVLSLLQVVVAAALNLGPQFAVLLGFYILLALTQLVLLCMQRDLSGSSAAPPRATGRAAWTMLLRPPEVSAATATPAEVRRVLGGWTIARHVALLAIVTLLFTAVFFCATPRLNDNAWQAGRGRGGTSGLATEVRLKQAGRIVLSDQVVMRALLSRMNDRQALTVVGEPYFTGLALNDYVTDGGVGRWVQGPRRSRPTSVPIRWPSGGANLSPLPPPSALVRQEIVLETGRTTAYPAIMPIQRLSDTPRELKYIRSLHKLERVIAEGEAQSSEYRYSLATLAIRNSRQLRAIPHPNPVATMSDAELSSLIQFDAVRFDQLSRVAAQAIRESGFERGTQLERALALERHFRTADLYQYSLDLNVERDESLDPIEDFVANHHTGHCEYFASALVMMLRSQGIPARMVIGFKGGELNSMGHYYVVQQRHAHAWVEAWIPPGEVTADNIAGPSAGGVWYRLDPTPPSRESIAAATEDSVARRVAHTFDYVELLWRDYVLSLNKSRQEDAIYDPLTSQATALPGWMEGRDFQRWVRRWSARIGLELPQSQGGGRRAFEGGLAIVVAVGLLALTGLVQAGLLARRQLTRWWKARRKGHAAGPVGHAFYWRLERLLARLPLRRTAGQTPQELAAAAEQQLSIGGDTPVAHLPAEIVAAYYRVRFGAARLDKTQTAAIEHALDRLTPAVSQARPR